MLSTPNFTFLFLLVFLISFFPSAFNYILLLPFRPFLPSKPAGPPIPTCACIPPPDFALIPISAFPSPTSPTSPPPGISSPTTPPPGTMSFFQKTINLPSKSRGSYLITSHIESALPEIRTFKVGIVHLFMQHTSAALSLNENWDEDVRKDMSDALDRIVPSDEKGTGLYRHDAEGPDDMPAHVKSALVGASVSIPISDGRLATGTWQGIWYLEFRASKHSRKVVATIQGEKA